jgi:hypothetical protein
MVIEAVREKAERTQALAGNESSAATIQSAPYVGVSHDSPLRTPTYRPRADAINAWLVVGLAIWAVVDSVVYGTLDGFLFTLPFMVLFGSFAFRLRQDAPGRRHALQTSGSLAAVVAGLCGVSLIASLAASPVDVACAVWSAGMVGGFGYAAWYQLRVPNTTSNR